MTTPYDGERIAREHEPDEGAHVGPHALRDSRQGKRSPAAVQAVVDVDVDLDVVVDVDVDVVLDGDGDGDGFEPGT